MILSYCLLQYISKRLLPFTAYLSSCQHCTHCPRSPYFLTPYPSPAERGLIVLHPKATWQQLGVLYLCQVIPAASIAQAKLD